MIGLACSSVSCDGFGDNNFVSTFAILPQVGFRYVEFNCWHPQDLTPKNIRNLRRRCEAAGLTPIAVYGSSFGGNNNHELSKDVGHKLNMIDAACTLGCHRIVATGAGRGQAGGLEAIITVLREITSYAEEKGVLICLENHANNNLATIEDYETVFSAITSHNVGLCIDTGHFDAANVDLDAVIERLGYRTNHIHVKEAAERGVEKFVRFGEGVTDNRNVIEQMLARGFNGYVSVELAIEDKSNLMADISNPFARFQQYDLR
jgi:sugar phosphate isomerase/epimerase